MKGTELGSHASRTIKLTLAHLFAWPPCLCSGLTLVTQLACAVLSISDTRRSTIQTYQRFMSTLLALVIGSIFFLFWISSLLGTGSLYRSLCFRMRLSNGLWQLASLVPGPRHPHLLIEQSTSWGLLLNELCPSF